MNSTKYLQMSARTMVDGLTETEKLVFFALGVAGEAGEVVEKVKKHLYHGRDLDAKIVADELGDVLWYAAGLCRHFGLTFESIMDGNIEKLKTRYPDKYNHADSAAQRDYHVSRTDVPFRYDLDVPKDA